MIDSQIKQKALLLRKDGYSYSYILNKTGISKSTLSNWFSDLPYKPNKETIDKIGKARMLSVKKKQELKIRNIRNKRNGRIWHW